MNRILHISITTALILLSSPLFGQSDSSAGILKRIAEVSGGINGIECDFIQKKHSGLLEDAAVSKGHMTYRKPDFLKWEYTAPFSVAIVVDKGRIDTERDGVQSRPESGLNRIFKEMSKLIAGSIDGSAITDGKLFQTELSESAGIISAIMRPLRADMKSMWEKLVIRYDSKTYKAVSFELYEPSGDYTGIEFLNSRYDISE